MKHGQHIPTDQRDDMARFAVGLASSLRPAEAKRAVAGLFKVSETTALHLISRGRFLTAPVTENEGGCSVG
jgi:hypothetical protein